MPENKFRDNRQPSKKKVKVRAVVRSLPQEGKRDILSDVAGSYTGTPVDDSVPVQDADDL